MAQHTSRQRVHLFTCQAYLDAMKLQGIENSITQHAANPSAFAKPTRPDQTEGLEKRKGVQKMTDFSMAVRIQALALAEASISSDRIREITGVDNKLLDKLRKTARDRGYDPTTSMQLQEHYVADPIKSGTAKSKKQKMNGAAQNGVGLPPAVTTTPGYELANTSGLPPGHWNCMAAPSGPFTSSLG
jgi:hypothetical protein